MSFFLNLIRHYWKLKLMSKNQIKKKIIFMSLSITICKERWSQLITRTTIMNTVNSWIELLIDLMSIIKLTRTRVREKWICHNNNHQNQFHYSFLFSHLNLWKSLLLMTWTDNSLHQQVSVNVSREWTQLRLNDERTMISAYNVKILITLYRIVSICLSSVIRNHNWHQENQIKSWTLKYHQF